VNLWFYGFLFPGKFGCFIKDVVETMDEGWEGKSPLARDQKKHQFKRPIRIYDPLNKPIKESRKPTTNNKTQKKKIQAINSRF
jgi:hypothetical protein